jgi:hypothetical protein
MISFANFMKNLSFASLSEKWKMRISMDPTDDPKKENACDLPRHNVTIYQEPTISIVGSVQKNFLASQRDASILPPRQHRMISIANFTKNLRFTSLTENKKYAFPRIPEISNPISPPRCPP